MRWLWFVGPLVLLATYVALVLSGSTEDERRRRALERWLDAWLGPLLGADGKRLNRRVRALPDDLAARLATSGGGARVADVVLVPKQAYLAVRAADGEALSDQHTVLFRLKKAAPAMTVSPLPVFDGRPIENRGVAVDETFGEAFLVEGEPAKSIAKWLDADVRAALLEQPELWLRTDGTTAALTLYGPLDPDRIDALVATADTLYAHLGATSATLFGDAPSTGGEAGEAPRSRVREARRGARATDVAEGELAAPALRVKAGAIDLGLFLVAALLVALTNGSFASFHPPALFFNPDVVVKEPWQGGFTTKGMGAFTVALVTLCALFAYQTYQAAQHGRSIGKWLVGLRVVREDGGPVDFFRGVLLRRWLPGSLVFGVAAFLTRPYATGAALERLLSYGPLATATGLVALGVATLSRDRDVRGFHDKLAGTKVLEATRHELPSIQLAASEGMDPVLFGQVARPLGLAALYLVALVAVNVADLRVGDLPQEATPLLVFVPLLLVALLRRLDAPRRA